MSKDGIQEKIAMEFRLLQQSVDAFDEAAATRLGLNRTDLRCLDVVLAEGPLPAGALSAAAKLSPAATTTVIDRLERAGYVTRSRDESNRRRVLVSATEAARTADADIFRPVAVAGMQALKRYDQEQLAVILDFLQTARDLQEQQVHRLSSDARRP